MAKEPSKRELRASIQVLLPKALEKFPEGDPRMTSRRVDTVGPHGVNGTIEILALQDAAHWPDLNCALRKDGIVEIVFDIIKDGKDGKPLMVIGRHTKPEHFKKMTRQQLLTVERFLRSIANK